MKTAMQETSIAAYRAMPVKALATQADRIWSVVCGAAHPDMSLREIQIAYRKMYCKTRGEYIDVSTISARVNALVAAKRLERLETTRKCSISGVSIHPVRVPG